jgi:hypothetical protein
MDIVLRNCGSVGWLGILIEEITPGNIVETYRTGKHHPCAFTALAAVDYWIEKEK